MARKILGIVVVTFLLSACSFVTDWRTGDLQYGKGSSVPTISEKASVDFTTVKNLVFGDCLKCHNGTRDPDLRSLAIIRNQSSQILSSVESNKMPPSGSGYSSLGDCQKLILKAWLEQGAPEVGTVTVGSLGGACQQAPLEPVTPVDNLPILLKPLNYETLYQRIIQPKCLHCHNSGPTGDFDASLYHLSPFEDFVKEKNMLNVDPTQSKFMSVLTNDDDSRMPPPDDGPRLSEDEIAFVKKWLEAGFPEK